MSEELHRAMGRIEGKMDTLIARFDESAEAHHGLEKRVRKLEGWQKWLTGIGTAIGAGAGLLLGKKF